MTENRASWQNIPADNSLEMANKVKAALNTIDPLIEEVKHFALDNHAENQKSSNSYRTYLDNADVVFGIREATLNLTQCKDRLCQLAFGENPFNIISRKEWEASNADS